MQYFIKEWPDNTASLIADDGYTLDTFENIVEALMHVTLSAWWSQHLLKARLTILLLRRWILNLVLSSLKS